MVCRPKAKGGLGIINLKIQNKCLLLKHLHNFYNNADLPWVRLVKHAYYFNDAPHAVAVCGSFWWRSIMRLSDYYRQICKCKVGNGETILFWSDAWMSQSLEQAYPRLFSFATDKLCSVKQALYSTDLANNFHLPLSVEAAHELRLLQQNLEGFAMNSELADMWTLTCSKDGTYIPKKVYDLSFKHLPNHFPSQWIWKSKCMSKHKFFAWLILHDRINTREMLIRRNWKVTDDHTCVLCPTRSLEDWSHLFFQCCFSTRIWSYLQIFWGMGSGPEMLMRAKKQFTGPCFVEIVILACWNIWKQRNDKIFKGMKPSFRAWKAGFLQDITLLKYRVRKGDVHILAAWIDNLL
jgi:hypothetical protein